MAIIIETCPKCGHDLTDLVIDTYPPIPQKKCFGCGWEWTGKIEEIVRVPFGGNSLEYDKQPSLNDYLIVNDITEKEIQECLSSAINTINTTIKDYTDGTILG